MADPTAYDGLGAPTGERRRAGPSKGREPRRTPEHDRMGVFAGRWRAEGRAFEPDSEMVSDDVFRWLPGGFFLSFRFDARTGESEHRGMGYMGYDEARSCHVLRMVDNLGYERRYELSPNGRLWTFRGETERATYEFGEDGRSLDIRWEQRDGEHWRPLCELKAVRTGGLGPTRH